MNLRKILISLFIIINFTRGDQLSAAFLERTKNLIPNVEIPVEISTQMLVLRITEKDHEDKCDLIYNFDHLGFQYHYKLPEAVIPKEFHDEFYAEKKNQIEENPKPIVKPKKKKIPNFMKKTENYANHGQKPKVIKKEVVPNEKMKKVPGGLKEKDLHMHQREEDLEPEDELVVRKREYSNYLKSAIFIINFLFVDLKTYQNFSHVSLGSTNLNDIYNEEPSVSAWFYSQNKEDDDYLYMRFKVSKIYEINGFPGKRIGFCNYDLDTLKNYDLINKEYSNTEGTFRGKNQMKTNMIDPFTKKKNPFKIFYQTQEGKVSYNLIPSLKGNFSIIEVIVKECDKKVNINIRREFIYRINLLLLSKSVLNMGNIGRYNKSDDCYYDNMFKKNIEQSKIDNFNNYRCQSIQYLRKLVTFNLENISTVYKPNYKNVIDRCKVIQDKIIKWDYLGNRKQNMDISTNNKKVISNFTFKAFQNKNGITNYLVSYPDNHLFLSTDVIEEAKSHLKIEDENIECFYHSDTYYTGKSFGEIYFITFVTKASKISELKI